MKSEDLRKRILDKRDAGYGSTDISNEDLKTLYASLKNPYGLSVAETIFGLPDESKTNSFKVGTVPDNSSTENIGENRSVSGGVSAEVGPEYGNVAEVNVESLPSESEDTMEASKHSSNWWLWLIGVLVVAGGIVVFRRK